MSPLFPALAGAALVAGAIAVWVGFHAPEKKPVMKSRSLAQPRWYTRLSRTHKTLLAVGVVAGLVITLITGWVIALILTPAVLVGLPILLSPPPASAEIDRLVALEDWTRSLSGVLTAGVGLEQALIATLRSTPEAIRPEVTQLAARLRARWSTELALRTFADDLGNHVGGVGDMIAANLVLGARRRGAGLATILSALAEAVSEEVRASRAVEADRAKPRATARWVTIITVGVLGFLSLSGEYISPYKTPLGQLIIVVLLAAYVATLVWMRSMAKGKPAPRFISVRTSA